jgi:hypothetical protein
MTMRVEVKNCDSSEITGRELHVFVCDVGAPPRLVSVLKAQQTYGESYVYDTRSLLLREVILEPTVDQ